MNVYDLLKVEGVTFINDNPSGVQLGFGPRKDMILEIPVQLRPGKYDVGSIGAFTYLGGDNSIFRYIKSIGRYCSIAGGIKTGLVQHPTDYLSTHPLFYGQWKVWPELRGFYGDNDSGVSKARLLLPDKFGQRNYQIIIGNDVWIGENVTILRGVTIGDGAIIASGALITKDVEPYAIVGGVPGKLIKYRFDTKVISRLLDIQWWNYEPSVFLDVDFTNITLAIEQLEKNIKDSKKCSFKVIRIDKENNIHRVN